MNTRYRAVGLGALVGLAVSVPTILACIFAAGAGHGTYGPAIVCCPYTMLLALPLRTIAGLPTIVAVLQFPAYGIGVGWSLAKPRAWLIWLALTAVHLVVAVVTFVLSAQEGAFWP